jgi:hypothetical protein
MFGPKIFFEKFAQSCQENQLVNRKVSKKIRYLKFCSKYYHQENKGEKFLSFFAFFFGGLERWMNILIPGEDKKVFFLKNL